MRLSRHLVIGVVARMLLAGVLAHEGTYITSPASRAVLLFTRQMIRARASLGNPGRRAALASIACVTGHSSTHSTPPPADTSAARLAKAHRMVREVVSGMSAVVVIAVSAYDEPRCAAPT